MYLENNYRHLLYKYPLDVLEYYLDFVAYKIANNHKYLFQFNSADVYGLIDMAYFFFNGEKGDLPKEETLVDFTMFMSVFNGAYSVGRYNFFKKIQFRSIIRTTERFLNYLKSRNEFDAIEDMDSSKKYNYLSMIWRINYGRFN